MLKVVETNDGGLLITDRFDVQQVINDAIVDGVDIDPNIEWGETTEGSYILIETSELRWE